MARIQVGTYSYGFYLLRSSKYGVLGPMSCNCIHVYPGGDFTVEEDGIPTTIIIITIKAMYWPAYYEPNQLSSSVN